MMQELPSIETAKQQARDLRAKRVAEGQKMGHAQALEHIAHAYGFRDWNAFHAALKLNTTHEWQPGKRVSGSYLSQPFNATVISVETIRTGWVQLVLDLDQPVDVVRFESFSNMRKQIRGVVGPKGFSLERTSDGQPHLTLNLKS